MLGKASALRTVKLPSETPASSDATAACSFLLESGRMTGKRIPKRDITERNDAI